MDNLEFIKSKVLDIERLNKQLSIWRFFRKKIVFTNGCFDLIHLGHIDYLSKAKNLGDVLLIGLNTDNSVRRLKGEHRPVSDQNARAMILASIGFVDGVVFFDEDTPYNLIMNIKPDVLVKGSDYNLKEIVGANIVKGNGGEIKTIDFLHGYSTTQLIEKIKKNK
jgi:rfaE bifunctional protein nucleotidyltransferase chain/domain